MTTTVLGSDFDEGFTDGKAGKPQGSWFGLFLRKGSYETGYKAGIAAREKEAEQNDSDLLGFDANEAKLYLNIITETAGKVTDAYAKAQGGGGAAAALAAFQQPAKPAAPVTPPISMPTQGSSGSFLTELHMGVPTYAWLLGGGAVTTGIILMLRSRGRRA